MIFTFPRLDNWKCNRVEPAVADKKIVSKRSETIMVFYILLRKYRKEMAKERGTPSSKYRERSKADQKR